MDHLISVLVLHGSEGDALEIHPENTDTMILFKPGPGGLQCWQYSMYCTVGVNMLVYIEKNPMKLMYKI